MKTYRICIFLFCVLFSFSCSKSDDSKSVVQDVFLESSEFVQTLSKADLQLFLMFAATNGIISQDDYNTYVPALKNDVKAYKITYYTTYKAEKIKASGLFFVPDAMESNRTIVYAHGTISEPQDTPSIAIESANQYTMEIFLGFILSSISNAAVLMPDYLGYGASSSITHPYVHSESLAETTFDFIQAFKEFSDKEDNKLFNNRLFITGYSEGGTTAVALHKKIQETNQTNFVIEKTVAGSGVYDHVAMAKEFFEKEIELDDYVISSYLWVLGMYKNDFAYNKPYEEIFSDEDNLLLKATNYAMAYFNPIQLNINRNPALLFRYDFVNGVLNENDSSFLNVLKANSLCNFVPNDSIIFVYGKADQWVYPSNTENAYQYMNENGGKVKVYLKEDGDHTSTLTLYLKALLQRLETNEN